MIKRVLISVSDKEGVVEFAKELQNLGSEIISTGGTAKVLRDAGVRIKEVSEITGFPEILSGRVKTLHPKIEGGILSLRNKEHENEMKKHGIEPIDMVVCNLYPFEAAIKKENVELGEVLENIDIGGPTMIRAAAKNFENVIVVVNPKRYVEIIQELKANGDISKERRSALATEAFEVTATYDSRINEFFKKKFCQSEKFPEFLNLKFKKRLNLRYGENPHQKGAFYQDVVIDEPSISSAVQLQGKDLSYTNILDLNTALELVREFKEPTVTIVKHMSPCAASSADTLLEAFEKAYNADPISAFGGIVGLNKIVDEKTAEKIASTFFDCVIAPDYEEKALNILRKRKNLRVMKSGELSKGKKEIDIVRVRGGILLQEHDDAEVRNNLKFVTTKKPTPEQLESLLFAWKVVKYVKSNAIVVAKGKQTIGIGNGQTNRIDSVRIALQKAGAKARGGVLASDGFFPFKDSVEEAARNGISAIIQPGGSIKDQESIDSANEHDVAMVFTGIRAFRH